MNDSPQNNEKNNTLTEEEFDEFTKNTGDGILTVLETIDADIGFVMVARCEADNGLMVGMATNSKEADQVITLLTDVLTKLLKEKELATNKTSKLILTH